MNEDEILNGLLLEIRRGVIVLSVLSQLDASKYGYSLMQNLEEKGVPVDAGTLYPLLRRLEKQGLLLSEWEVGGTKPRKYYILSEMGRTVYAKLCTEWESIQKNVEQLIQNGGETDGTD